MGSAGSPDRPTDLPVAPRAGPGLCLQAYISPGHVACQTVSCNCVTGSQSSPPTCSHWSPGSGDCRLGGHDWVSGSWSGRLACFSSIGPRASSLFSRGLSHFHPPPPPSRLLPLTPLTSKMPLTPGQGLGESHLVPLRPHRASVQTGFSVKPCRMNE